jgi:hypothetical protein
VLVHAGEEATTMKWPMRVPLAVACLILLGSGTQADLDARNNVSQTIPEPLTTPVTQLEWCGENPMQKGGEAVFKPVNETHSKTCHCMCCKPVQEICFKECRYTVNKPICETSVQKDCPQQVSKTVYETLFKECCTPVCRLVCETRYRDVCTTTCRPVCETVMRTVCYTDWKNVTQTCMKPVQRTVCQKVTTMRTVTKKVPYTVCETYTVRGGQPCIKQPLFRTCFDPCVNQKDCKSANFADCQTNCHEEVRTRQVTKYRTVCEQVPCTTTVRKTVYEQVPVTICTKVPHTCTKQVPVKVTRFVCDKHKQKVPYTCNRIVTETVRRQIPYCVTRTVCGAYVDSVDLKDAKSAPVSGIVSGVPNATELTGYETDAPGRLFVEGARFFGDRVVTTTRMEEETHVRMNPCAVTRYVAVTVSMQVDCTLPKEPSVCVSKPCWVDCDQAPNAPPCKVNRFGGIVRKLFERRMCCEAKCDPCAAVAPIPQPKVEALPKKSQ